MIAPSSERLRVVVVDDHALFRDGCVAALAGAVDVVGTASDVASAIEAIGSLRPDVAVVDVHLPDGSGADVISAVEAAGRSPSTMFLGISVSDEPADVMSLVRAGARGYVTKRIESDELIESIHHVAVGNAVFSPRLAGFVLEAFRRSSDAPTPPVEELDLLSAREREVMHWLARGYTYREIAAELYISDRTVESHARAVLRKLQLSSRHEITHWAARHHLL